MVIQLLLLAISLFFYYQAPNAMDRGFMIINLVLVVVSIVNCYRTKERNPMLRGQIMRHSFIFLLAYCVVFYQYDIDYVLRLINVKDVPKIIFFDYTIVAKALAMANIGLNSFLLGYLYMKRREKNIVQRPINVKVYTFSNLNVLVVFCWVLIAIYIITINKAYLFNGYAKGFPMGNIAFHCGIYIMGSVSALVVMQSYELKRRGIQINRKNYVRHFRQPFFMVCLMTLLILMSGRRTDGVRFLLILALSYVYLTNIKFKMRQLIIPVVGLSVVMYLISVLRMDYHGTASQAMDGLMGKPTVMPITYELAFNCSSLHIALSCVPSEYPFVNGYHTLIGLSGLVPGLQSYLINSLNIPLVLQNSAFLITEAGLGDISWGLGTSIIADIYVNYGLWGIPFFMFPLGLIIRVLETRTFSIALCSPYVLALSFCFYTSLIYMVRGNLLTPFTSITYFIFFVFVFSRFKSK